MNVQPPGAQLDVEDATTVLAFCAQVFDAVLVQCEYLLDGQVLHAELNVGGNRLTISEWPESPPGPAKSVVALTLTALDPRTLVERALAAGATLESTAIGDPPAAVVFRDPSGYRWMVTTASATTAAGPDRRPAELVDELRRPERREAVVVHDTQRRGHDVLSGEQPLARTGHDR